MTLQEQCETCASYEMCKRILGKFLIERAMGWKPEWIPDDGNPHPICGCRHRVPIDGAPSGPITEAASPAQQSPDTTGGINTLTTSEPLRNVLSREEILARIVKSCNKIATEN